MNKDVRRTHRHLDVWRDGIDLVRAVYELTAHFPRGEQFGLVAQLRRAAIAAPSNIAEGAARGSRKEFARFVAMARGSVAEVETQLVIAAELGYCDHTETVDAVLNRLYARLNRLHSRLIHHD
ncbi:hypothetical protein PC39_01485 [Salinisphaera sp. PC39]|uniref:four helix bundle protein n=1 Tax=Salinisphaera sp. PC39 TaxID=1304156 RepID=UPI003340B8A2